MSSVFKLQMYCAIALFGLAATPAAAAEMFRENSGLVVVAPPGYLITPGPDHRSGRPIDVKKAEDKQTGCHVGYQALPENAARTQAQINAIAGTAKHAEVVRVSMSNRHDVRTVAPFEHKGVRGIAVLSDPKLPPGAAPLPIDVLSVTYLMETPKGRAIIVCIAEKTTYDARRPEFDALARGVTVPR